MQADWVRRSRDQFAAAGVKFFFKQWRGTPKHLTGRAFDGHTHDERPTGVRTMLLVSAHG